MPQQLIYTSAPRGVVAGRSGHCTVACSDGMREALQLRLEQISYYEHLAVSTGRQPIVCAHRIIDIRGTRYHVLSRMVDAGLDFTKRTNFTAHHLVFQPNEVLGLAAPPVVFLHWSGWRDNWQGEPQLLRNEDWGNLFTLAGHIYNPARHWSKITGDAANAAALLESKAQDSLLADGLETDQTLPLIAESLALMVVRPSVGSAWQQTFTTFLQERDELTDFRWRLVYSGTSAHSRLTARGAAFRTLSGLRCGALDELTAAYARSGPQPLQISVQPLDQKLIEGQSLVLKVVARGVPPPTQYQWFTCSRDGRRQPIPGGDQAELRVNLLPLGISRYQVVITNAGGGTVESRVSVIQVDRGQTPRLPGEGTSASSKTPDKYTPVKPDEEGLRVRPKGGRAWVESDMAVNEVWDSAAAEEQKKSRTVMWVWAGIIAFVVAVGGIGYAIYHAMNPGPTANIVVDNADSTNNPGLAQNTGSPSGNSPANEPQSAPGQVTATTQPTSKPIHQSGTVKTALVVLRSDLTEQIKKESDALKKNAELGARRQKDQSDLSDEMDHYNKENASLQHPPPFDNKEAKSEWLKAKNKEIAGLREKIQGLDRDIKLIDFENQTNNLVQHSTSHLAELQAKVKDQGALANSEITKKLKNIFPCPADGQFYFQVADLQITNPPSPSTQSGLFNVKAKNAEFKISFDSASGFISITKIDVVQNDLEHPLLVLFSTSETPTPNDNPMPKLVIWPRNERIDANCDISGDLHINNVNNNAKLFALLNDVKGTYKNGVNLSIQYPDGRGGFACQTNFEISSVLDYKFTGLSEKLKSWDQQLRAIQNFQAFESNPSSQNKFVTNTIWGEVDNICQQLTDYHEPFGFESEYKKARELAVSLVKDDDQKPKLMEALSESNIDSLNQFINTERNFHELSSAKERLQYLLPKSKEGVGKRLMSWAKIIYDDREETLGSLNFN